MFVFLLSLRAHTGRRRIVENSETSKNICKQTITLGDNPNLISILQQYSISLEELYALNPYINFQILSKGQPINIPKPCDDDETPERKIFYIDNDKFPKGTSILLSFAYMLGINNEYDIGLLKQRAFQNRSIYINRGIYQANTGWCAFISTLLEEKSIVTPYFINSIYYTDSSDSYMLYFVTAPDKGGIERLMYNPFGPDIDLPYSHTVEKCRTY
jgi:hypothetical protein